MKRIVSKSLALLLTVLLVLNLVPIQFVQAIAGTVNDDLPFESSMSNSGLESLSNTYEMDWVITEDEGEQSYSPLELVNEIGVEIIPTDEQTELLNVMFETEPSEMATTTAASDFTYSIINGSFIRITGYTGSGTAVVISDEIGGYIVQEIASNAFQNKTAIQSMQCHQF